MFHCALDVIQTADIVTLGSRFIYSRASLNGVSTPVYSFLFTAEFPIRRVAQRRSP
jgi:hypothetical protein